MKQIKPFSHTFTFKDEKKSCSEDEIVLTKFLTESGKILSYDKFFISRTFYYSIVKNIKSARMENMLPYRYILTN